MQQAFFLSAAAGFASAFLYGALAPGALIFAPLLFISPVPLLVVGLGWHPLIAALGALIASLGISLTIGSPVALSFAAIVGLPAYLLAQGISVLVSRIPASDDPKINGQIIGIYVLGGIALYAVLAMIFGAMAVEPSYEAFESRVAGAFARMMAMFGETANPRDAQQSLRLFVRIFLPMSCMIVAFTLTLSLWLSTKVLARLGRLPFTPLPAYEISIPRDALFWLVGAALLAQSSGYTGLGGSCALAVILFLLLINGLTLLHKKTLGAGARVPLLWAAWLGLTLFAPSALIFSVIGALDAAFDIRSRSFGPDSTN